MATAIDNSSLLLYRVGPVLCCAPSLAVESITQPPSLTKPPGTDEANPGIFMYSGHVVTSFDLRYKFGVDEEHRSKPGRTIVVEVEPSPVGFWVDEIVDVITFPSSGWGPLPTHFPRGIFSRTLILDNKIYLYAEFQQLLNIPTSGYLRVYIEQLLLEEEKKKTSAKPAIETAASRSTLMSSSTSSARPDKVAATSQKTPSDKEKYAHENYPSSKNETGNNEQNKSKPNINDKKHTPSITLPESEKQVASTATGTSTTISKITKTKPKENKPVPSISSTKQARTISETTTPNSSLNQSKLTHNIQQVESKASSVRPRNRQPASTTASTSHSPAITSEPHSAITKQKNQSQQPFVTKQTVHAAGNNTSPLSSKKSSPSSQKTTLSSDSALGHSQNKTEYKSRLDDDDSSNLLPVVFVLLLLVGSFAGLFWYLTEDSVAPNQIARVKEKPDTPKPVTDRPTQATEQRTTPQEESTPETVAQISPETEATEANPVPVMENSDAIETGTTVIDTEEIKTPEPQLPETQPSETKIPPVDNDLVEPESDSVEAKGESESPAFKADIQKDDEGITIILEAPANENVFKQAEPNKKVTSDEPPSEDSASADMISEKTSTNDMTMNTSQPKETLASDSPDSVTLEVVTGDLATQDKTQAMQEIREEPSKTGVIDTEIIHIVVKGDTLWHIAIKYVNDPYKYPELAKLSNIKNPDLIYPGNRVRIIKRSRQIR